MVVINAKRKQEWFNTGQLNDFLEPRDDEFVALAEKAFDLQNQNKWEEAMKLWSELRKKRKNKEWPDFFIAMGETRLGQFAKAEKTFDRLIKTAKDEATVFDSYKMRAEIQLDYHDDLGNAFKDINIAIKLMKKYRQPESVKEQLKEAVDLREEILDAISKR
jgi:tetratricopeptide (TPR) repeat protein